MTTSLGIAKVRTSDRIVFKRCRRKWSLSASMKRNLQSNQARGPLWMGSGFHYALEDFHGVNRFGHPKAAFEAYVRAHKNMPRARLPDNLDELVELCSAMLDYYMLWINSRDNLQTYIHNGEPQVEVRFQIPLPIDPQIVEASGYSEVYYTGTIDRVLIDEHGQLWLTDYKTAASFVTSHFELDPQVTSYMWAASCIYDKPIAGFIYQQHKKSIPKLPELLKSNRFSIAKNQVTTYELYRQGLLEHYGEAEIIPPENKEFLKFLQAQETDESDALIRRDRIHRSQEQLDAEGEKILLEVTDMLNPNLPLYPNPTRDCSWDCPFNSACLLMDCGDDFEEDLDNTTMQRDDTDDNWRNYL